MNNNFYYQNVKNEVSLGHLKLISIIAPARSGSTFFMRVLAQSSSVHSYINQPFHLTYSFPYIPPHNREEVAYQRIWEDYQKAKDVHSDKTILIVVKCMARNLGIGSQASRFIQLADANILLIRNPILSVDSLLREQVLAIKDMPEASTHNLNDYAFQKGFVDQTECNNHWKILQDFILLKKDYKKITDLLIETLSFIELNQYEANIINDYKSHSSHDFNNIKDFFSLSWTGWNNLKVIYEEHLSHITNYFVVDSSVLRCIPEYVCRHISNTLNISYIPQMIKNWELSRKKVVDHKILKTSWMQSCYTKAANSSEIKLPKEPPISISLFPSIYQQHILNTALPLYESLLKNSNAIQPHNHREIHELLNTIVTEDEKMLRQLDPVLSSLLLSSNLSQKKSEC